MSKCTCSICSGYCACKIPGHHDNPIMSKEDNFFAMGERINDLVHSVPDPEQSFEEIATRSLLGFENDLIDDLDEAFHNSALREDSRQKTTVAELTQSHNAALTEAVQAAEVALLGSLSHNPQMHGDWQAVIDKELELRGK